MILLFEKECPTRHNNKKSYKEGQSVVISDEDYGKKLIKEGFAKRIDKNQRKLKKYQKQEIEKGGNE